MIKKINPRILIIVLALVAAFVGGTIYGKQLALKERVAGATAEKAESAVNFEPTKSKKPNFKFFVMAFCPFGNQAEMGIKPVAELLSDKVEWEPHYIVNKQNENQVKEMCQTRIYDKKKCQQYVGQGYFPDLETCKQQFYSSKEECFKKETNNCLATKDNNYYCSLHGKQELNQDVREICAWNLTSDKKKWWQFVDLVNKNCQPTNADSCWQNQAGKAGLDESKIQECFNKQGIELLDKEVAVSQKFSVTGSPSVFVNDTPYPPEGAYDQEGKAKMTINKELFSQNEYRSPEAFKQSVCAGFNKQPKECRTELPKESGATGGC